MAERNLADALSKATTLLYGVTRLATDGEVLAGEVVDSTDSRLTNARTPTGAAGGVLSGTYPNPAFAVGMATQAGLDTHAGTLATGPATNGHMTGADAAKLAGITAGANIVNPMTAYGDLMRGGAAGVAERLANGIIDTVLTTKSGAPFLAAPAAPVPTTAATGGTVAAGTYTVAVSYVNAQGETVASASGAVVTTGATSTITIPSPPASGSGNQAATGWYAYVSQADLLVLTRQQATPTAIGVSLTLTAPPTATGAGVPAGNTAGTLLPTWSAVASSGHTIQDEGVALAARTKLDFIGSGVTVNDDATNDKSVVNIPGGMANPLSTPGDMIYASAGTPSTVNLAVTPTGGTASASASSFFGAGYEPSKAIDGNTTTEWVANGASAGTWFQVSWTTGQSLNRISMQNRGGGQRFGSVGTLTFSDGSSVGWTGFTDVSLDVSFARKTGITWVCATNTSGMVGADIGFAEFRAFNDLLADPIRLPVGTLNQFLSVAASGSDLVPFYRALLASDIPLASVVAKTAAYTLTAADRIVTAEATAAAFTLTLPTAVGITGREYIVKRLNAGINNVTVDAADTETIDGALTYVLTAAWQVVRIVSDGANWIVV